MGEQEPREDDGTAGGTAADASPWSRPDGASPSGEAPASAGHPTQPNPQPEPTRPFPQALPTDAYPQAQPYPDPYAAPTYAGSSGYGRPPAYPPPSGYGTPPAYPPSSGYGTPPAWGTPDSASGPGSPWAAPGSPEYLASPGFGAPGGPRTSKGLWIGLAAGAVAVLAVLVAGLAAWHPWSGSGPASSGPTGAAARAGNVDAWVQEANAYCRTTADPGYKAATRDTSGTGAAGYRTFAKVTRDLDAWLRAAPPATVKDKVTNLADRWDRAAALYDKTADALDADDTQQALAYATQAEQENQAGNAIARSLGLPDCADAGALGTSDRPGPSASPGIPV